MLFHIEDWTAACWTERDSLMNTQSPGEKLKRSGFRMTTEKQSRRHWYRLKSHSLKPSLQLQMEAVT